MKDKMINKFFQYCEEGNLEGLRECLAYVDVDSTDKSGNSVLHVTTLKGYTECVRVLIAAGANLNVKNLGGDTPLHAALLAGHVNIAMLLIQSGSDIDCQNASGDCPIHIAAKKGYTNIVHTLCAFGCLLDFPNDKGFYPMHLAAKNGNTDIIRYLCLFGSNVEQKNFEGIKAEILAFKYEHYAAGELLNKLRIKNFRQSYINQLMPTSKLLAKFNVKFLGCAGTGKSSLIRSLKTGYFSSFFSRSTFQNATQYCGKTSKNSSLNIQIEMDKTTRQTSLNELPSYELTQGIEISQASFASGEVNLWDFSGLDTYFSVYDYFLGDSASFYVIVFNLSAPSQKQYYQCAFWLEFLHTKLQASEPSCIRVLLVGTHADLSKDICKDAQGSYFSTSVQEMKKQLIVEFPGFIFENKIILVYSHLPNSSGIREIKSIIGERKISILQNLVKSTQFLETTVQCLKNWRKEFEIFPVMPWKAFVNKIHRSVNPLAGSEHIGELIYQLSIMGEIFYLSSKAGIDDLIIIDVNWLCSNVIGALLSLESITKSRITGCYTEEDFQSCFPHGAADKILNLLSTFQICTQCENDGDIEYEFPCYNLVEKLDGLWAAADERYSPLNSCYGGVRLKARFKMLQYIFTRIQVQLRRAKLLCQDPESDLYQWFQGSKFCLGDIESFITLEEDGQSIEVKVRGTNSLRPSCFYFLNEILNIINEYFDTGNFSQALSFAAPGLLYEKHVLSSEELRIHAENPFSWPPEHLFLAISSPAGLHSVLRNPNIKEEESLLQLIGFGCENVHENIILGGDLSITELSANCQQVLAQLLDPPDPFGKDWCLLAVKLGLSHKIASLDNGVFASKTLAVLDFWGKKKEATIGTFVKKLIGLGREDAAKVVMLYTPLYKILLSSQDESLETAFNCNYKQQK